MTTLKIKQAGSWTAIAGDVVAQNPINDFITYWTPGPWTAVTFQNSWVNSPSSQNVQYRKRGDIIDLRGRMRTGTIGAAAFTLPVGFRPLQLAELPTASVSSGTWIFSFGYVDTAGQYVPLAPGTNQDWAVVGSFSIL